jgi:mannose-6-phosphate isomerase-like protein (cupin superfamily)
LNAWYQLYNSSHEPSRFVAVTNAPAVINMFGNTDFVFGCGYEFLDRFSGEDGYFDAGGTVHGRYMETNFVPDVRTIGLYDHSGRGAGGTNIGFEMAGNNMKAHISQFPVGTYKKAHRHEAGAHVIILSGTGYSMMWKEGEPPRRYDWADGSMVTPPNDTFHQHFNTGREPARYLALRMERGKRDPKSDLPLSMIDIRQGGNQIEYADEDILIRKMYRAECQRNGATYDMAQFFSE